MEEEGYRPHPNFQQFGESSSTGRELGRALDPTEALLRQALERGRAYAESRGESFSPSRYMYKRLLGMAVDAMPPYPVEVHSLVPEDLPDMYKKMAVSLGILAYLQWEPERQRDFREGLQEFYFSILCDEAEQDWDREEVHDHYISLPDQARQLLKRIANVTDIPYSPEQTIFQFSSVLNQPEPQVPQDESTQR